MTSLAVVLGRFIGAVLAECGPVIVAILREAFRDTAEEGKAPEALREELQSALRRLPDAAPPGGVSPPGNANGAGAAGRPGANP